MAHYVFLAYGIKPDTLQDDSIPLRRNGFLSTVHTTNLPASRRRGERRNDRRFPPFDGLSHPIGDMTITRVYISVVMPAYNEGAGIGRILRNLLEDPAFGPDIEVIVAANGCTDDTVDIARSYGVRVIDIPTPSKTAALNAADEVTQGDVLIYQDADIPVTAALLRQLAAAVGAPGIEAAVPGREIDTSGCSWPVRAFYAINGRLPVFRRRLFGRGVIAVSRAARSRFDRFPEITADDMFLDAIVAAPEKAEIESTVRVGAPRTTPDLVRRVARARDGNAEFWRYVDAGAEGNALALDPVAGPNQWAWLGTVVRRKPALLPAALCYAGVVVLAEARRRSPGWDVTSGWGRGTPASAARMPRQRQPADDTAPVRGE